VGPAELPVLWRESALEEGLPASERELACRPWVEELPLCFRVEESGRRRWVTRGDLARWGATLAEVEAVAAKALVASPFEKKVVHGGSRHYYAVEADSGREAMVVLHPEWLQALGTDVVLAIPARDAVLAWSLGDAELDKIMAVGVRKLFEASSFPVSRKILSWDGSEWTVRGEVTPAPAPLPE
jgi:diadenosine tetraphosphatase ApaH/serine/threonine PP2A family protein phosphatase